MDGENTWSRNCVLSVFHHVSCCRIGLGNMDVYEGPQILDFYMSNIFSPKKSVRMLVACLLYELQLFVWVIIPKMVLEKTFRHRLGYAWPHHFPAKHAKYNPLSGRHTFYTVDSFKGMSVCAPFCLSVYLSVSLFVCVCILGFCVFLSVDSSSHSLHWFEWFFFFWGGGGGGGVRVAQPSSDNKPTTSPLK